MRRREFLTLLSSAAVAWPDAGPAQQLAMPVIGFIGDGSLASNAIRVTSFQQGLSQEGFIEGRNVAIEYRWAEGRHARLPELATELARNKVAVIITGSTPGALAVKAATTTIPIIFY